MKSQKPNLVDEVRYDLNFVKSHTLQPQWYKIVKIIILTGFLIAYGLIFGLQKMLIFFGLFIILAAGVHMVYRVKTKKFTQTWMDFVVYQAGSEIKMKRIGIFYYSCVFLSVGVAIILSQVLG